MRGLGLRIFTTALSIILLKIPSKLNSCNTTDRGPEKGRKRKRGEGGRRGKRGGKKVKEERKNRVGNLEGDCVEKK